MPEAAMADLRLKIGEPHVIASGAGVEEWPRNRLTGLGHFLTHPDEQDTVENNTASGLLGK
jgi:hypothetical protein